MKPQALKKSIYYKFYRYRYNFNYRLYSFLYIQFASSIIR